MPIKVRHSVDPGLLVGAGFAGGKENLRRYKNQYGLQVAELLQRGEIERARLVAQRIGQERNIQANAARQENQLGVQSERDQFLAGQRQQEMGNARQQ